MKENQTIHILYTSDLHGYLLPIQYSDNLQTEQGLSKLIPAIESFQREDSIILDLGDILQGSPLMYYHQLNRKQYINPAAELFNVIDYDYFIPGNHDFNYGKDYLDDFINQINAKILCQNIYQNEQLAFQNGFDIKTMKNGIKVLIIGATTKYIPHWENPANIKGLLFKDVVKEVKTIVDTYKKEVDLIICAYHGGFERDIKTHDLFVKDTGENQGYALFEEIPEINILLTGHQHRVISETIDSRVVMQPGSNGAFLGTVDVLFDSKKKITSIKSNLLRASDYPEDPRPKKLLQKIEKDTQSFLDEVIGEVVEGDLEVKDPVQARIKKHAIVDFINDIQLDATNAQLSATSIANQVSGFKKHITIRNVLSTYVYPNTLVVVDIDGKTLREYLERCAEYFVLVDGEITYNPRFSYPKLEHYNYDMIAGVDYAFDLKEPFGNRVKSVRYQGKEISNDDHFTLALNNYRASGGGDFEMLQHLEVVREIPFDIAELMIEYLRIHHYLHIKPKNNIVLLT